MSKGFEEWLDYYERGDGEHSVKIRVPCPEDLHNAYGSGYRAGLERAAGIAESKGAHCMETGDCASNAIAAAIRAERGAER